VRKVGCTDYNIAEVILFSRYATFDQIQNTQREQSMVRIQNIGIYTEPKTITKQVPLFEEEDDGNLVPYNDLE
jgi:hypothetical protein